LQKVGKKKWNKRLARFVKQLDHIFHFTRLHIGGGNSQKVDLGLLPANVTIVSNMNGLIGGIALWRYGSEKPVEPPIEVPKERPVILKSA
jgi:polyphosphate glucokinase